MRAAAKVLSAGMGLPVRLLPFGSTTYGLGDENSDVDCFLQCDVTEQSVVMAQAHHAFANAASERPARELTWDTPPAENDFPAHFGTLTSCRACRRPRTDGW